MIGNPLAFGVETGGRTLRYQIFIMALLRQAIRSELTPAYYCNLDVCLKVLNEVISVIFRYSFYQLRCFDGTECLSYFFDVLTVLRVIKFSLKRFSFLAIQ